ncbi:hypothetical protein AVEN_130756-1 [Araneus ventricosus]|uniref:Uncharacterized protein n=1 Tax=Araneus ventricosus TaxID=182803 RepID=A0A4Y2GHL3_ARAVE|nr:hypothetical protein AVEN_130756-1 [Araneus ventricosus]
MTRAAPELASPVQASSQRQRSLHPSEFEAGHRVTGCSLGYECHEGSLYPQAWVSVKGLCYSPGFGVRGYSHGLHRVRLLSGTLLARVLRAMDGQVSGLASWLRSSEGIMVSQPRGSVFGYRPSATLRMRDTVVYK